MCLTILVSLEICGSKDLPALLPTLALAAPRLSDSASFQASAPRFQPPGMEHLENVGWGERRGESQPAGCPLERTLSGEDSLSTSREGLMKTSPGSLSVFSTVAL